MRGLASGLILAAFALSACPDDPGDDDGTSAGGGAAARWGDGECWGCLAGACALERDACAADPGCAAWLGCELDCPAAADGDVEAACAEACPPPATGAGEEARAALESCQAQASCPSCGAGGSEGGSILDQDCPASTLPEACDKCEAEGCCETPCDAACEAQIACQMTCNDWTCSKACYEQDPVGQQSVAEWLGCMNVKCHSVCPNIIKTDACGECTLDNCSELYAKCFAEPACYLRMMCGSSCDGDAICYDQCDAAYPTDRFDSLILCVFDQCAGTACSGDPQL